MQRGQIVDAIRKGSSAAVQIEHYALAPARIFFCRDPPAIKARRSGLGVVEANIVELQSLRGGRGGNSPRRTQHHLPLSLIEEQAQRRISTDRGDRESD